MYSYSYQAMGSRRQKTKIGGNPAMLETSKTMCAWLGSIEVDDPGIKNIEAN